MTYPCHRCNMDEGSPVCLQDERCQGRRIAAPERTVASITDADVTIELAARRVAATWDSLGSVAHPVQASLIQQRLKRELDDLKNLVFNTDAQRLPTKTTD